MILGIVLTNYPLFFVTICLFRWFCYFACFSKILIYIVLNRSPLSYYGNTGMYFSLKPEYGQSIFYVPPQILLKYTWILLFYIFLKFANENEFLLPTENTWIFHKLLSTDDWYYLVLVQSLYFIFVMGNSFRCAKCMFMSNQYLVKKVW